MQFKIHKQKINLTALLFLLLISTAACSPISQVESAANIRPLEEIYTNGPPEITDITSSEAVLVFDSGRPVACSAIYGETTDYGMISVDQDMQGGAHSEHHPILDGLKPDTEYHYRLQGTAPDGTIYISKDMTFRTPVQSENEEINLASLESGGSIQEVSSNFGGAANDETWGANSAIDGSRATAWSSDGDGNEAFIVFQFASAAQIDAIEVWTRSMSDNTAQIFSFTLTTDSGEKLGPFTLDNAEQSYRFEVDIDSEWLRLDVEDSSGGNTGLIEFAAYGSPLG
jgi:hypothetical protein